MHIPTELQSAFSYWKCVGRNIEMQLDELKRLALVLQLNV